MLPRKYSARDEPDELIGGEAVGFVERRDRRRERDDAHEMREVLDRYGELPRAERIAEDFEPFSVVVTKNVEGADAVERSPHEAQDESRVSAVGAEMRSMRS